MEDENFDEGAGRRDMEKNGSDEEIDDSKEVYAAVAEDKEDAEDYDDLKKRYGEVEDRILRLTAEFDNYKKRSQSDIARANDNGKMEVIKDILSVMDEFELALISTENSSKSPELNVIIRGLEMIYTNLNDALKRFGVNIIKTDIEFDPNLHDIIMVKESDKEEGSILEVIKKGYRLNERVIRPASVIIAGKNKEENND